MYIILIVSFPCGYKNNLTPPLSNWYNPPHAFVAAGGNHFRRALFLELRRVPEAAIQLGQSHVCAHFLSLSVQLHGALRHKQTPIHFYVVFRGNEQKANIWLSKRESALLWTFFCVTAHDQKHKIERQITCCAIEDSRFFIISSCSSAACAMPDQSTPSGEPVNHILFL